MRFICTLIFLTAASRLLMDCLALVVSRTYSCGPTGIHIFEYLKSCYLIVWIPIILHLDADWGLPFWYTDRFWHIINCLRGAWKNKMCSWTITKVWDTTSRFEQKKFISYLRPLLQDWKRCFFVVVVCLFVYVMHRNPHRELRKMKKQSHTFQIIQDKTLENVLNEMEISDSPDKEFKTMALKSSHRLGYK